MDLSGTLTWPTQEKKNFTQKMFIPPKKQFFKRKDCSCLFERSNHLAHTQKRNFYPIFQTKIFTATWKNQFSTHQFVFFTWCSQHSMVIWSYLGQFCLKRASKVNKTLRFCGSFFRILAHLKSQQNIALLWLHFCILNG